MTTLKERAREIALQITGGPSSTTIKIESALLAFAKEVLEREPSEEMKDEAFINDGAPDALLYEEIYNIMSAVRAKELAE